LPSIQIVTSFELDCPQLRQQMSMMIWFHLKTLAVNWVLGTSFLFRAE
jgi:hypothetical protein